jgi:hypothetical protein
LVGVLTRDRAHDLGRSAGRLDAQELAALDEALALVLGL